MGNFYFLERMMIERMREVAHQAEVRNRLRIHTLRPASSPGRFRRLVGAWLIQAGRRLQQVEPDPRTMTRPAPAGADGIGQCGLS
jgi:hypothetical protein